jgi:hypothetical protein
VALTAKGLNFYEFKLGGLHEGHPVATRNLLKDTQKPSHPNNTQKLSLYLTGNTLRHHYNDQPVGAV